MSMRLRKSNLLPFVGDGSLISRSGRLLYSLSVCLSGLMRRGRTENE